ncbi:Late embryogenesis abundant protein [Quillaja saponaria]|uniref:Late embryogenesis abundant protein n=1 Tax=Quillaja saponaria TaxID=32244 RepID=A0AAD7PUF1_QUISA|nr:Late embryogenesis abundant protein [Quillaja saponaria]
MYSPGSHDQLPFQSTPKAGPIKRHQTARYFAHRVRESLTTRVSKLVCTIFLGLLLIVGIITFILWISLRPHRPRIHIQDFSLPGLDQVTGFENAQIAFNVTVRNSNLNIGIYYGIMGGSIYYKDQKIGATPLLDPFYQEPKNTTVVAGVLRGVTLTVSSQRWKEFNHDRTKRMVVFRLQLTSTIQFKISTWESKRHPMHADCDVSVGPNGLILQASRNRRCATYFF